MTTRVPCPVPRRHDGSRAAVGEGELAAAVVQSLSEAVYSRTGRNPFRDELAADVGIAIKPLIAALKEARAGLQEAVDTGLGLSSEICDVQDDLDAVTAERDRLAGVIARVEGLADNGWHEDEVGAWVVTVNELRAALTARPTS